MSSSAKWTAGRGLGVAAAAGGGGLGEAEEAGAGVVGVGAGREVEAGAGAEVGGDVAGVVIKAMDGGGAGEDAVREAMPGTRDAGMLSAGALTERGVAAVVDSRGGDSVLSMRRGDGAVGATL